MTDTILISGRVVNGHPMKRRPVTKQNPQTKVDEPVMDPVTGLQRTDVYFAVAIPKTGETGSEGWKTTPWGAQIAAAGARDWPTGEHASPGFFWKIIDGDSTIPNKKGIVPNTRQGWSGHWIVNCSTMLGISCHHVGKYQPVDQIQNEAEIKCGDYCRVGLEVKGNGPSQSPGVYMNPRLFELTRAGEPIISEGGGPAAADVFGGGEQAPTAAAAAAPPAQPPAAGAPPPVAQPSAAAPPAAPTPAKDFLNPPAEVKYYHQHVGYTKAQLTASGWTEEQVVALPLIDDEIPH